MYCQNCGTKNENDSRFCMNCGEKLATDIDHGNVEVKETNKTRSNDSVSFAKSFTDKIGPKNLKIGGLVVGVLILVLILSSVLGSGGSGKVIGILYAKDGELHMTNNDKEGERFSDEDYSWRGPSGKTGEYIYFLDDYDYQDEEGDLKLKRLGKKTVEIEDNVYENFVVSPSGRRVLFLADYDGYNKGELYLSVDGKKPEKIADDVVVRGFIFGEDETEIAYVAEFEDKNESGTLYYKKEGREAEEIDNHINFPLFIKKGGNEIYFAKDYNSSFDSYDLYLKSGNDDIDRISKDIVAIVYNKDFSKSLDISVDGDWELTFDIRSNKQDGKEIDDKITDIDNLASITRDSLRYNNYNGNAVLHAKEIQDLFAIYVEDNDKVYIYKEGFKPVKLADYEDVQTVIADRDCNVIAYIDNDDDTLYATTFKNGKLSEPQEIDDDVYSVRITEDGKSIVYLKDYKNANGELFVATIKGESEKIYDDVAGDFRVSEDGKEFVFVDENDNLLYMAEGQDKQEIAEDVYRFVTIDFKTVYYTNYDDELFKVIIGEEPVKIDDEVEFFILLGDLNIY